MEKFVEIIQKLYRTDELKSDVTELSIKVLLYDSLSFMSLVLEIEDYYLVNILDLNYENIETIYDLYVQINLTKRGNTSVQITE